MAHPTKRRIDHDLNALFSDGNIGPFFDFDLNGQNLQFTACGLQGIESCLLTFSKDYPVNTIFTSSFQPGNKKRFDVPLHDIFLRLENERVINTTKGVTNEFEDSSDSEISNSVDDSDIDVMEEEEYEEEEEALMSNCVINPVLQSDIHRVELLYSPAAIDKRIFHGLDDIEICLKIDLDILQKEVCDAWGLERENPLIIQLHVNMSGYMDYPVTSICVYQNNCQERSCVGSQMKKILENFVKNAVKKNPNMNDKIEATYVPLRGNKHQVATSSTKKNAGGINKRSMTKKLDSLRNSAKEMPVLNHGFLVQIMEYAMQRLLTLSDFCVICDQPHVCQSAAMLKPAVCGRELCIFAFQTLGVMVDVTDAIASGAEVVELLVTLAHKACFSPRNKFVFDPFPTVVDPKNPQALSFNPKEPDLEKAVKVMDYLVANLSLSVQKSQDLMSYLNSKHIEAYPLLRWIISSNRSYIVKLKPDMQLPFMKTNHQFLLLSSPPKKEAAFREAKKKHGSTFAFHGSRIENWHRILRVGLINASGSNYQLNGAAHGHGIYLSPMLSTASSYSNMRSKANIKKSTAKGTYSLLQEANITCLALCEVVTCPNLKKIDKIWVQPNPDHVVTRFFFVYDDAAYFDSAIDTQARSYRQAIVSVVSSSLSSYRKGTSET